MRFKNYFPVYKDEGEVIAAWGQAQLVKYLDGKLPRKVKNSNRAVHKDLQGGRKVARGLEP
jgi:hypothetical protein